ncbi:MAG: outer membrane beta-barrel protein, partial [Bacteroidota bacterium]
IIPADVHSNASVQKLDKDAGKEITTSVKALPKIKNVKTNNQQSAVRIRSSQNTIALVEQKKNVNKQIGNAETARSISSEIEKNNFDKSSKKKIDNTISSIEKETKKFDSVAAGNLPATKINEPKFGDPNIQKSKAKDSIASQKIAVVTVADTTNLTTHTTPVVQLPGKNKWQLQLNAAAGRSGLSSGINVFDGNKSLADASSFSLPQTTGASSRRAPSAVQNGFSFSIGASAGKPLSKRLSFSVGLQYNYYSTRLTVGVLTRQDSVTSNAIRVESFYANSGANFSSQKNAYHFLSLPVLLHWQANKKIPLFFNTGFALQQMIGLNALVYDGGSNIYYTDNSAFNKTQLFMQASVSYRLINNKKFSMRLGPQLQYGFSQLEKNKSGNHLSAAAISAQIIFPN